MAQNEYEETLFTPWFEDAVLGEIEYIQSGGAHGEIGSTADYLRRTAHCPACGAYKARKYYREAAAERERCNDLDSRVPAPLARFNWRTGLAYNVGEQVNHHGTVNALCEYISDYGGLYQYGRGGATLAPDKLMQERGGNSAWPIHTDEWTDDAASTVWLIRVLESFNRHVEGWCASVPEMWADYKTEEDLQPAIDAHDGMRPVRRCITEWVRSA